MRVSFLNAPTLAFKLPQLVESCFQMDICIAFIKIKGLRRLLSIAEEMINRGGKVRIVFGLSRRLGITDEESVKELLEFSKRMKANKQIQVRRYDNPSFHPKVYIFHGKHPSLIVGSSNLTDAAVTKNVEANLLVEDADERLFKDVKQFFKDCFEKALPLTNEDYRSYKPKKTTKGAKSTGNEEDELPEQRVFDEQGHVRMQTIGELLDRKNKNRFYIMHLSYGVEGYREECWQFATEYNLIGLSHKRVNDDWPKIRDKIKDSIDPGWVGQFDCFCEHMKKNSMDIGDLVLILWGQSHLLGIAEITGDHDYSEEYADVFFDHIRPVSWIVEYDYEKRIEIPQMKGFKNTLNLVKKNSERWFKLIQVKL